MNNNICRAYKVVVQPQKDTKKSVLEIAELPQRSHLLISFTNADLPGGVGILLDRDLAKAVIEIFKELEFRMEGARGDTTRVITVAEGKRADEDTNPF